MSSAGGSTDDRGLLGSAERALNAPAEGTLLRPYITQARQAVTGAASTVTAGVDSLVEQVDATLGEAVKSVDEVIKLDLRSGMGTAESRNAGASVFPSFALLRPEIKLGVIVGATALVSSRFGVRALVRNTTVGSLVGGYVAYPSFWDKAKAAFLSRVDEVSGTKR